MRMSLVLSNCSCGIVPTDVIEQREISTTLDAIREYLRRVSVPDSDRQLLNTSLGRLPSK
jgi:hypothetical protein